MVTRTIMIFPQFSNQKIIDNIREKYDPLYNLVKPHITLVFPFESDISDTLLSEKLDISLKGTAAFQLTLQGISRHKDVYGNYIFFNVKNGQKELIDIHKRLYLNIFDKQYAHTFIPHMTIGNLDSEDKMENAYDNIKSLDDCFETVVNKVSVEMIGNNGESIIICEKKII